VNWYKKSPTDSVGLFHNSLIYKVILAERTGLEPATPGVTGPNCYNLET